MNHVLYLQLKGTCLRQVGRVRESSLVIFWLEMRPQFSGHSGLLEFQRLQSLLMVTASLDAERVYYANGSKLNTTITLTIVLMEHPAQLKSSLYNSI